MSLVRANQEICSLLKDGAKVSFRNAEGNERVEKVCFLDWKDPQKNDYFLASQFWVLGEMYKRRPDLLGFVNVIPLVFIELKGTHIHFENVYKKNLKDYRDTIPQLFWYNALVLLSNGSQTRIGSLITPWGHYGEWKKINSEGEEGIISLETAIRGVCEPSRLLDLVENFTLFAEVQGGLAKLVAKHHQYLGVNNAIEKECS